MVAIYKSYTDRNKAYTPGHKKTGLFLMICCDVMLLVGIYQWYAGDWGLKSIQLNGMGEVMKNSVLRFYAIEHTTAMLIAIVLALVLNAIFYPFSGTPESAAIPTRSAAEMTAMKRCRNTAAQWFVRADFSHLAIHLIP